jgi:hypothetical protein
MKIQVNEVERAAMAAIFSRPGSWGGPEGVLLAQDEIFRVLELGKFDGMDQIPIAALSTEAEEVDIPDTAIPVLRAMLGSPGQNSNAARIIAPILRRLVGT